MRQYGTSDWTVNGDVQTNWSATRIGSVIDELGVPFETITYSHPGGLVVSTELAGGVDRYTVSGDSITDPLGSKRRFVFNSVSGGPALANVYQPAGAGCAASNNSASYDSTTGNLTSKVDLNGVQTCYVYDAAGRNVELARIEGLASYAACSAVTPPNATLPTGSRKVSSQWHPDWRLQTKVAEPGRITTQVYNGQPDPFNANALASCAPAGALLPDGKPIAVLCKQVEQATTDTDGHLGFSAALEAGVADRQSSRTYNQFGQVLTAKGARTDVNDTTTFAYYTDTTADHTLGDLQSVTNAVGKITQYTKYNKHGQLLETIDPNGVLTVNTYDLRQRLLSTSVGGRTTRYTYDAVGQLTRVTRPDLSYMGYAHDAAHRMTAVFDNLGNRIDYTLDNAGNRTAEKVKDPGGALSRQLSRSIDALGRVQQTSGRE